MVTIFGFLNLAVGLALLLVSLLAGGQWQEFGSRVTFVAGSVLAAVAALILLCRSSTIDAK